MSQANDVENECSVCLCLQHERQGSSGRSRDGCETAVDRGWSTTHYATLSHHSMTQQFTSGKIPKPSFDALTPPQGSASHIVNSYGPGGMTPLMVAAMSPASEAAMMTERGPTNYCIQFKPSTSIISDLVAEGASTEDRTDFSGAFSSFCASTAFKVTKIN